MGILVDRVCRVKKSLIDDEEGSFREGKEFVNQIMYVDSLACVRVKGV